MADRDAQKRIDDLFKLIEPGARPFLKQLYDYGGCYCTIDSNEINRMFIAQWSKVNPKEQPNDEVRKLIGGIATDIREEWEKVVTSGKIRTSKIEKQAASTGTKLRFIIMQGESESKQKQQIGKPGNQYNRFKDKNSEIVNRLANSTKYKSLFVNYSRNKVTGTLKATTEVGHVRALGSAGRADAAIGLINGILRLDDISAGAKAELKRVKDSLLELKLNGTTRSKVQYRNGQLEFRGIQEYVLETPNENKGVNRRSESEEAKAEQKVKGILRDGLKDNAPKITEYVNQKGSPSMMDIVGDMVVNTPVKTRAYNKKQAKNLSKYKAKTKAKSSNSTATAKKEYKGKEATAKFGFDSAMAAGLPRSVRPGVQSEGGSGQSPEDFAQKIRGLLKVKRAINARLPAEIRRNMGKPSLTNRTGRFSNSAEVTSILPAAQTLMVKYSYRLNPYETFENTGKKKWPSGYNPKPLIAKSIRGLALGLIDEKLTIRRE